MEVEAKSEYSRWNEQAVKNINVLKTRSRWLSWLRLLIFLLFSASFVTAFAVTISMIYPALILLALFVYLLIYHEKVNLKIHYEETYSKCLLDELAAQENKYPFDSGEQYVNPEHPFTSDLDIFGKDSIFNSLNRTVSKSGSKKLADLFIKPDLEPVVIKNNQQAVKELSEKRRWLLDFRVYGLLSNTNESSEQEIISWATSKAMFNSYFYITLLYLAPVVSILITALTVAGIVSVNTFMLYMFVPLGISGIYANKITKGHSRVSRKAPLLTNYSMRLKMIENEEFKASYLIDLQNTLGREDKKASVAIKKLSRIISSMDARLNWLMWIILNFFTLWDIRQMRRLELWQSQYKDQVPDWFNTLASIEAIGSLSSFAILNPSFTYPETSTNPLTIDAENAGHPLIPHERRVDNPIGINGKGSFNIITGANMAGKSTYLRTVGVNLVLAMTGAPVCAERFSFFPAVPYTSLHTIDSLSTNKSYFFAELERLKLIIDTLNNGGCIYVFLDEILKGTNSYDKQNGSKALLRQLVTLGSAGMIATHDLDLGQLEQSFPQNITNYCFEASITNNELSFDYKLNRGIARNMNATFLMKHMGITV